MSVMTRGYGGSGSVITRGYGGWGIILRGLREVVRFSSYIVRKIELRSLLS